MKHRVLIVDDHPLLRAGLRALLEEDPTLEIVGEAGNGREAVHAVNDLGADLVLMDLNMPGMNGLEALSQIRQRNRAVRVLVLTMHQTEEYIHASLKAGANGYILKDSTHAELKSAIRNVLLGKTYLGTDISAKVVSAYLDARRPASQRSVATLTQREREVLKLLAEGKTSKEIGQCLGLSEKTVGKHRSALIAKLGIRKLAELTAYAIEKGLLQPGNSADQA
jgi:DNA-binding NarL/FixJ family response regulator